MSAMSDDIAWLDATAQADLVRRAEISPAELVDGAIARIEKLNPELNAVIHPLFERARDEPAGAGGKLPEGPFRGVPFLLKDLGAELAGTPFCEGSAFAGDYRSTGDQELTARFRRAGFVVCGKTNTPEFGILPTTEPRRFGPSRNPWHTGHSTGGSSGGSAAAVASGMVPVAHANDGGGSIRIPASCCGLVGPQADPGAGLDGTAVRRPDGWAGGRARGDAARCATRAAVLDATAGPVPGDPYWAPPRRGPSFAAAVTSSATGPLRIAVMTASPSGSPVHPDCVKATEEAAALCESLGHHVEPATLDVDGDAVHRALHQHVGRRERLDPAGLGGAGRPHRPPKRIVEPLTWALVELGRSIDSGRYLKSVPGAAEDSPGRSPPYFEGSMSCSPRRWVSLRRRWAPSTRLRGSR